MSKKGEKMKCTVCGYKFIEHDWEIGLSIQMQAERMEKKVMDHYKRDHTDLVILLSQMLKQELSKFRVLLEE